MYFGDSGMEESEEEGSDENSEDLTDQDREGYLEENSEDFSDEGSLDEDNEDFSDQDRENPSDENGENLSDQDRESPLDVNGENLSDQDGEHPLDENGENLSDQDGEHPPDENGEDLSDQDGEHPLDENGENQSDQDGERSLDEKSENQNGENQSDQYREGFLDKNLDSSYSLEKAVKNIPTWLDKHKELRKNLIALTKNKEDLQTYSSRSLEEFRMIPSHFVAFVGATGSGKSTVINTLLEDDIVPTSSSKACTSVVTEISYNDEDDYRADIHFVTRTEWMQELKNLKGDIGDDIQQQREKFKGMKYQRDVTKVSDRITLVDLPGFGDSNEARSAVAEEYRKTVDHYFVVIPVTRAVDSKFTKVTKCDDVQVAEIATDYDLDQDPHFIQLKEENEQWREHLNIAMADEERAYKAVKGVMKNDIKGMKLIGTLDYEDRISAQPSVEASNEAVSANKHTIDSTNNSRPAKRLK
ncbi:hypothetical protein C0992_005519 [Termitomyces sp. T32_za158]|nr:hypothetical protein C0992_005519 [Termitomyces sp. T32_za158]